MRTARKILKNTVVLSIGKGVGDLGAFLFLMLFGRTYGAEFLGKYAFAMSLGGMVIMFSTLGFNTLIVKEVSRNLKLGRKYVGNLLLTRLILAIALWLLFGIAVILSPASHDTKIILIIISGYHVFYQLTSLVNAGFSAWEEMQYPSLLEFFHRIIILLLGGAAILLSRGPFTALAAYPLSAFLMFLLACLLFTKHHGKLNLRPDFTFIATATKSSLHFFLLLLLAQFNGRIGVILLTWLRGETETGIFAASDRLMISIAVAITFFGMALFPVMSRCSLESREKMLKLCRTSVRLLAVSLLPLSLILTIFGDQIIFITFGKNFIDSVPILKILVWGLFITGLNLIVTTVLIVEDKQRRLAYSSVFQSLAYVALGIFFIDKASGQGLALAKVIISAIYFPICLAMTFTWQEARSLIIVLVAPLLSLAVSIGVLWLFCGSLGPVYSTIITIGAFCGAMIIFKGIGWNDIRYLQDIVFR
ncbi:hypothetical protein MNBD_DELTA03-1033 [hydrothermal vent metagenome]|uniref:Polysaccharide biosynthesis protein C-terminal domain-containing protein n=1 Tax=hydrothermal vent metagenome TaxID=652676 RepID=A0A3B0US34_9ZZZZ